MKSKESVIPVESVIRAILLIRGQKVMVDADLAVLYGIPTKALNQAVKRNIERFPSDFMFELTEEEKTEVVTNCDHLRKLRFSTRLPCAFTEHGALMLASVLNSPRAVEMSIYIVRAYIRIREFLATNKEFVRKLNELEQRIARHDGEIQAVINTLRQLMEPPPSQNKRRVGFEIE